jgi:8-amino-7-oxononanoate synthase
MFGSNDYLGLSMDPRVRAASVAATERYGTSCTGSRLLNGTLQLHEVLEARLAAFVGKEAAAVFGTGFQTNVGVLAALLRETDTVFVDHEAHASILDGCRMSGARLRRFPHNDAGRLDDALAAHDSNAGALVVVEGVYSMSGSVPPLADMAAVCRRHGVRLVLDDAHGIGVLGRGHGTAAEAGCTPDVDLIIGTFSKSFASIGGFVAGPAGVIEFIRHNARPFVFSAALPPGCTAAVLSAIDVIEAEPERVERLHENARALRAGLTRLGLSVPQDDTPIIPITIRADPMTTARVWKACFDRGMYVNAVISPAVPPGRGVMRMSCMATHTAEHIERALKVWSDIVISGELRPSVWAPLPSRGDSRGAAGAAAATATAMGS